MEMLRNMVASAPDALLRHWRDEAQHGLEKGGDMAPRFAEAIEVLDAEMKKRADTTVPPPMLEMLRNMADEALVKVRATVTRTSVPQHDEYSELRAVRVANFIKAINAEFARRYTHEPVHGVTLSLPELNYLCLAVAEFEDASEEIEKTIGVPLYQRLQQTRALLADLT